MTTPMRFSPLATAFPVSSFARSPLPSDMTLDPDTMLVLAVHADIGDQNEHTAKVRMWGHTPGSPNDEVINLANAWMPALYPADRERYFGPARPGGPDPSHMLIIELPQGSIRERDLTVEVIHSNTVTNETKDAIWILARDLDSKFRELFHADLRHFSNLAADVKGAGGPAEAGSGFNLNVKSADSVVTLTPIPLWALTKLHVAARRELHQLASIPSGPLTLDFGPGDTGPKRFEGYPQSPITFSGLTPIPGGGGAVRAEFDLNGYVTFLVLDGVAPLPGTTYTVKLIFATDGRARLALELL